MFTPCSTLAYRTKAAFFQCPKLRHPHPVRQLRHAVTCPPEVALPHQTAGSLFFQTASPRYTQNTQGTLPIARPLRNVGNLHRPNGRQAIYSWSFLLSAHPHRHRRPLQQERLIVSGNFLPQSPGLYLQVNIVWVPRTRSGGYAIV